MHSGSAALRGPFRNHELAARALQFSYDIDALKVDARLAKAIVWERGYLYAWAAQKTDENAASTLFVLEKQARRGFGKSWPTTARSKSVSRPIEDHRSATGPARAALPALPAAACDPGG